MIIEEDNGDASDLNDLGRVLAMINMYGAANEFWGNSGHKRTFGCDAKPGCLCVTDKAHDHHVDSEDAAASHLIAKEQMCCLYSNFIPAK